MYSCDLIELTRFEGEGRLRRVLEPGQDLFHRLAYWDEVEEVELDQQHPFTAFAARQLRALGFVEEGSTGAEGFLCLRRRSESPTAELEELEKQYDRLLHPGPLDLEGPDGDLEGTRREWIARAQGLSAEDVNLWAERYWLFRRLGAVSPLFLKKSQARQWKEASERVMRSLHEGVLRLAESEELRWHILGSRDPIVTDFPFLARLDGSLQPDGPIFFELNVGAIGFSDTDRTVALYRTLGLPEGLPGTVCPVFLNLLAALSVWRERAGLTSSPPSIAIPVAASEEGKYAATMLSLIKLFRKAGWRALFCPLRTLRHKDGKLWAEDGTPVDMVARAYFPGSPGTEELEEALREGAALLVNPPAVHGNKGVYELVEDPALPWSRIVCDRETSGPEGETICLLSYAVENREGLVLKPTDGYGGAAVMLGNITEAAAWEQAVRGAAEQYQEGRRWILQMCAPMPASTFVDRYLNTHEQYWDLDAFVFGGKFGGLAARLSSSTITNISLGGGAVCVYVV